VAKRWTSVDRAITILRMRASQALLWGWLTVGTIDFLDAIIFSALRSGTAPMRVFQGVAFGVLGRDTYQGGWSTFALGTAIHYVIAFCIVGVFLAASRVWPFLVARPWVYGGLYGVGVYFFMNRVVIPMSLIGPQRFVLAPFVNGILIHIAGVGIPSALFAAAVPLRALP
jgi:hypothetical protein